MTQYRIIDYGLDVLEIEDQSIRLCASGFVPQALSPRPCPSGLVPQALSLRRPRNSQMKSSIIM